MKVKIGDKVYDSEEQMVWIEPTEKEIDQLKDWLNNIDVYRNRICFYPEGYDLNLVCDFMEVRKGAEITVWE